MKIRMLLAVPALLLGAACAGSNGPDAADAAATVVEVDRSVDCPALAQAKYPFLTCTTNAAGQVVFDGEPEVLEVSQMPEMDSFVESDGYWGH